MLAMIINECTVDLGDMQSEVIGKQPNSKCTYDQYMHVRM